jgi:hypothetical protein
MQTPNRRIEPEELDAGATYRPVGIWIPDQSAAITAPGHEQGPERQIRRRDTVVVNLAGRLLQSRRPGADRDVSSGGPASSGRGAARAATAATVPRRRNRGRRPGAQLRRRQHAVQGVAPPQPESLAREGGRPAAAGYHTGLCPAATPDGGEGRGGGGGWGSGEARVRPCLSPGRDAGRAVRACLPFNP